MAGGGIAGVTAAVTAARAGLRTLLMTSQLDVGSQLLATVSTIAFALMVVLLVRRARLSLWHWAALVAAWVLPILVLVLRGSRT